MPSSAIRAATDPDEYRAAARPPTIEYTITTRGRFTASITRIDLHHLWLQRGQETLPRIWRAVPGVERSIITFLTRPGSRAVRNGVEFQSGEIALHSPRHGYHHRSLGPLAWAAMSLPVAEMAAVGAAVGGRDLMPQHDEEIVRPTPAAMRRLQQLHAEAGNLAERAPHILARPEAARGLEQALIEAMVDCLAAPERREDGAARRRHTAIMQRFHATIEASDDRAVYLPELCSRIGVSGRTLRLCCQEHLGMGPKHFLLLRRLHLARRALREAAADATVTDIATEFGFWELGRFAVEYKALFGEAPSAMLRQGHGRITSRIPVSE
jgi:AraC-like DNA-binding protein